MLFRKERSRGSVLKVYIMDFQKWATYDCCGPRHKVLINEYLLSCDGFPRDCWCLPSYQVSVPHLSYAEVGNNQRFSKRGLKTCTVLAQNADAQSSRVQLGNVPDKLAPQWSCCALRSQTHCRMISKVPSTLKFHVFGFSFKLWLLSAPWRMMTSSLSRLTKMLRNLHKKESKAKQNIKLTYGSLVRWLRNQFGFFLERGETKPILLPQQFIFQGIFLFIPFPPTLWLFLALEIPHPGFARLWATKL